MGILLPIQTVLKKILFLSTISFNTSSVFGFLAIALAAINIFGGFLVTQRMLAMYKKKKKDK